MQIINGIGMVYLEDTKFQLEKGDNIYIPKGDIHRLENIGEKILTLIEIKSVIIFLKMISKD